MDEGGARQRAEVWRPGVDGMEEDEELEYDPTAYDCLHAWSLEWPCLSFDVIRDELGENRTHFPHSLFAVAGTQAANANQNNLTLMRVTQLKKTRRKEPTDGDDSEARGIVRSIRFSSLDPTPGSKPQLDTLFQRRLSPSMADRIHHRIYIVYRYTTSHHQ